MKNDKTLKRIATLLTQIGLRISQKMRFSIYFRIYLFHVCNATFDLYGGWFVPFVIFRPAIPPKGKLRINKIKWRRHRAKHANWLERGAKLINKTARSEISEIKRGATYYLSNFASLISVFSLRDLAIFTSLFSTFRFMGSQQAY
jgi:hypothetical protein